MAFSYKYPSLTSTDHGFAYTPLIKRCLISPIPDNKECRRLLPRANPLRGIALPGLDAVVPLLFVCSSRESLPEFSSLPLCDAHGRKIGVLSEPTMKREGPWVGCREGEEQAGWKRDQDRGTGNFGRSYRGSASSDAVSCP